MNKIVLIGDSILARTNQNGAMALIPRLKSVLPAETVEVLAVGGASSETTLQAISGHSFEPDDSVVISIGLNDAAPWKQIPFEQFIANYQSILEIIGHNKVILLTPTPVDIKKQESPGRSNATIQRYADGVKELASTRDLMLVDGYTIVNSNSKNELHVDDGVHLNTLGYDLISQPIIELLK